MEKALMILGNSPEDIANGLLQFAEQYKARHQAPPQAPDFETDRMTVKQAARFAQVSYKTCCYWITSGQIPIHGKGRNRFVLKSELIENLKSRK